MQNMADFYESMCENLKYIRRTKRHKSQQIPIVQEKTKCYTQWTLWLWGEPKDSPEATSKPPATLKTGKNALDWVVIKRNKRKQLKKQATLLTLSKRQRQSSNGSPSCKKGKTSEQNTLCKRIYETAQNVTTMVQQDTSCMITKRRKMDLRTYFCTGLVKTWKMIGKFIWALYSSGNFANMPFWMDIYLFFLYIFFFSLYYVGCMFILYVGFTCKIKYFLSLLCLKTWKKSQYGML